MQTRMVRVPCRCFEGGNGTCRIIWLTLAGFHGNAAVRLTSAEPILPKPDDAISSPSQDTKEGVNASTGIGTLQVRPDLDSAKPHDSPDVQRLPSGAGPAKPDAVKSSSVESTKTDASNRSDEEQACLEFDATSPRTGGIIADALREKCFEVTTSEISPGEFRVLVRPAKGTSIDQLRIDLERAGFHGNAATIRPGLPLR